MAKKRPTKKRIRLDDSAAPASKSREILRKKSPGRGGPGATTKTLAGLRKKTYYVDEREWQALRAYAFKNEITHTEVIRKALREFLGL